MSTGTKISIVALTIKLEPFLFTNYNSLDNSENHAKYSMLAGDALV